MPANAAHYLFAEKMLPALKKIYPELDPRALYYGAQGPDVLFFHRALPCMPGKSLRRCGSRLHKINPAVTFQCLADYLTHTPGELSAAQSYVYGFLLHFCLDRRAHVYINAVTQAIMKKEDIRYSSSIIHNRIESNLDTILLKTLKGQSGNSFHPERFLSDDPKLLLAIAAPLSHLINCTLSQQTTPEQLQTAFSDTAKIFRLLTDESGRKTAALGAAEKLLPHRMPIATTLIRREVPDGKWDYANYSRAPWPALGKKEMQSDTFYDMIEKAALDALETAQNFTLALSDGRAMETVTGTLNFSGLPGQNP